MSDSSATPKRTWRRRTARAAAWTLAALFALVVALVALVAFVGGTQSGLPYAIAQLERLSGGRLTIEGATGALLSTLNVGTLRWKGDTTTLVAHDVIVDWDPAALARRELHVRSAGARTIDIAVAPSSGGPSSLPSSLGLPLTVVVDHASVTTFDYALGERKGRATGIAFAYRGDARGHRLDEVTLAFDRARITGRATLDAASPFALAGAIGVEGSDAFAGYGANATLGGTLSRILVAANGRARDARFDARAALTPFATAPIDTLDVDATGVDPAAFGAALPHATLALAVHARPARDGFTGTLTLANTAPGTLDADRMPVTTLSATFAQRGQVVSLGGIDARAGDGNVRGDASFDVEHGTTSATLALAGVDLRALHSALAASRVSGTLRARVDADAQAYEGDLADRARGLALDFAARVADRRVALSRARLTAAAGTLQGRGELALDGARAFTFRGTATRFDPSRLGRFPAASLEGTLALDGHLEPAWSVSAEAKLGAGATIGAKPASGHAKASLAAGRARGVDVDLRVGDAHATAHGDAGASGDALAFTLDAPHLAALVPLVPGAASALRDGAVAAHGTLAIAPSGIGGSVTADASQLALADGTRIASLALDADVGMPAHPSFPRKRESSRDVARDARASPPGTSRLDPRIRGDDDQSSTHPASALADRVVAIDVRATGIATEAHAIERAHVTVKGTLAAHALALDVANAADHATLAAHGALTLGPAAKRAWRGTIDAAELAGTLPVKLVAPAALEWTPARTHLGVARIAVADGDVALDDLVVEDARVTTRGSFTHVPLGTVATLAGQPLPIASTLTLDGHWNLTASPRLDGTLAITRHDGDLFAAGDTLANFADYPIGVDTLALDGRVRGDAWTLDARFASLRAGTATLHATLAPGPTAGVPSLDAALEAKLDATLASLAPLQPWLGTSAVVDGRAELHFAAAGTLRAPSITGTLDGSGLHVDMPQYGIALADGRVRATLGRDAIALETFTFRGGDGMLEAHGTLARAKGGGGDARITWHASKFRLMNRPDARIVVSGEGGIAFAPKKLAVDGRITVDEGRIVYSPAPVLLSSDVVIKGRPRNDESPSRIRVPVLALDLEVDLGRALTFSGEGLETGLAGRVHVTTTADGRLEGKGTIVATRGSYYAFGQRLTIDRGRLIFDGPLDNPALDVVALRKNLAVEAGVSLTGTVRVPRVQLTSNPPVPDAEKLSWLITGQAPGNGSAADAAALAAASSWLLGGGDPRPIGTRIAQNFGFDELTLHSATSTGAANAAGTPASGQVVSIGKRLSDRLTLVYEQGLTIATNALRLEYTLSRSWTVRAEAGTVSGIGLYFRRTYR